MLLLLLFLLLDLHSVSRQLLRHVTRARSSPGMQTHREYDRLMAERGGAQQQQHKGQGQGSDKDKGKGLENGLVDKDKDMGSDKGKDKDKRIVKEQDQEGSSKVEDQGSDKDKDQDSSKYKGQVLDQDSPLALVPSPLALVLQVHADSCHYCAGGLFRAANLLLSDVINHRQRCYNHIHDI